MKKIILITGHSRGIGKKLVNLLKKKFKVIGVSRSSGNISGIREFLCDINNYKDIELTLKKIGKFDILINNSSITLFSKNPYENFSQIIKTNLIGTYNMCQNSIKYLKKNASIINISSINSYMAFPNNPGYVSSKGGVKSLTQALALDYSKYKIRVNSISPGYINEGMSKASYKSKKKNKERLKRMIIKRWGTPNDLYGIIEYLSSNKSSYVTGQDFVIDGGWTVKGL
jgi:NAD(P)-dependent dehydrogenase (short-subunit alcohol dehydrogenase family)